MIHRMIKVKNCNFNNSENSFIKQHTKVKTEFQQKNTVLCYIFTLDWSKNTRCSVITTHGLQRKIYLSCYTQMCRSEGNTWRWQYAHVTHMLLFRTGTSDTHGRTWSLVIIAAATGRSFHISSSQMNHAGRHLFFSQRCASFASPNKDFETFCPKLGIKKSNKSSKKIHFWQLFTPGERAAVTSYEWWPFVSHVGSAAACEEAFVSMWTEKESGLRVRMSHACFHLWLLRSSCITALFKCWKRRSILFSTCLSSSLSTICIRDLWKSYFYVRCMMSEPHFQWDNCQNKGK